MHLLLLSLALGQAEPVAPPPRAVDFTRLDDGSFRATLDGEPVAGAAFYRAVLRPDLAARTEETQFQRTALLIAAVVAPVAGLGIGWVAGTAQQWPLPPCVGTPPGPVSCVAHDQVAAKNTSAMNAALVAGGLGGLATGLVLGWLGTSTRPHQPTADEAEVLVRDYQARTAPPAPPPGAPGGGPSLGLEAGPRAVRLALHFSF